MTVTDGKGWMLMNKKFPPNAAELKRQLLATNTRVEAIHEAIKDGDNKTFKQLADTKQFAFAKDINGDHTIHLAVLYERMVIASHLLMTFPDSANLINARNRTALHYAAFLPDAAQSVQFSNILLSAGVEKKLKDYLGHTAEYYQKNREVSQNLYQSLISESDERIFRMSSKKSDKTRKKTPSEDELKIWLRRNNMDPLSEMLQDGQRSTVQKWAKKYPKVAQFLKEQDELEGSSMNSLQGTDQRNVEDSVLESPEAGSEACSIVDAQIDEWLAEGDIENLEKIVLDGRIDLLRDKESEHPESKEFISALGQYQAKIDAIFKAVEEGDVRRVKNLIDRPALAQAKDRKGLSPLHKAVVHGQTDTVRYLLMKFPDSVNLCDHEGRTPLHYAAADKTGGHYLKLLQKAGADAFIEDKHGHTPFYYQSNSEQLNLQVIKGIILEYVVQRS